VIDVLAQGVINDDVTALIERAAADVAALYKVKE
jgi:hypothetical protein